ncbi:MAG: ATP-binding protein [Desulfurivibrionaceae bacterium]|nr:ATP-binding protein [Desulfobulbales bacterium]MDT8334492.1 ATP-binding protein [Desulfurivibrionaceae bacterium]
MKNDEALSKVSIKPFALVKFFSFTTLLVFLVFTPIFAILIANHANGVMLRRSEEYALVFARNINQQLYERFIMPSYLRYGSIIPSHPGQQKRLDIIIRNITHGMKVEAVSIFDQQEDIVVYSTINERVGQQGEGGEEFMSAKEGRSSSRLEVKGSMLNNLLPGSEPPSYRLISYIPLRSEQTPAKILGVIEIIQDMSDDYLATIKLQWMISGIAFLFMFVLFVILRLIVARADRIIEARARDRLILEDRLRRSEHLASLGKMIASVSHEIKNPLGIVRSTAEMLRKRIGADSDANKQLTTVIIDETARLDRIVREFLDFAKPREINLKPAQVEDIVREAVGFVSTELEKSGISNRLRIEGELPMVPVDRELFYRALLNILLNGIQVMPEGGSLSVRVGRAGANEAGVVIEIADTGPGIPEDSQDQIFKPFYTDKTRGTGLGLAIAKNIIDNHHGEIEVDSVLGVGTTFRIKLG